MVTQMKLHPSLQYRRLDGEQHFVTENYVSSPPALIVLDECGSVWSLGFQRGPAPKGEYAFSVLKDGYPTGVFASRIERRGGRIRCFTGEGWKIWSGRNWF
jgi:hypothetical protein